MTRRNWLIALSVALALGLVSHTALAQQTTFDDAVIKGVSIADTIPRFGGPSSVGGTIVEDLQNRTAPVPDAPRA